MLLVGLTGGIASGKSTVARRFAELGAVVVDADAVAREVVEPGTEGLARVAEEFGPGVLDADGKLDRAALGAIVFADRDRLAALNAITHPAIRTRSRELFAAAGAADPHAVVVYDVPLLAEGRAEDREFDEIVVVEAPAEQRIERMVAMRGMTRDDAEQRIRSQATDAERRAIADHVIDNGGAVEQTLAQTDAVWQLLHRRAVGGAA